MTATVINLPTVRFTENVRCHFDELFVRMRDLGLSEFEQIQMIVREAEKMGAREVNGTWIFPGTQAIQITHDRSRIH